MFDDPQRSATRLGVELEARLLARLLIEWRGINYTYFKSVLRPPVVELVDLDQPLARWDPVLRTLEVSRPAVLSSEWAELIETLKRQAVQQFIDERLRVVEHRRGPTYRRICLRLGVHPVPRVSPGVGAGAGAGVGAANSDREASREPLGETSRIVSRIHKLLALAGSPNRHEAETAAATAQRLILKFNIMHSQLGASSDDAEAPGESADYGFRRLGRALGRRREHDQRLAKILNDYFFVASTWVPVYVPQTGARASVLEVCGLELNLIMAEHVHAFLGATSTRLWADYARSLDTEPGPGDRGAFLAGVMAGFECKLAAQQQVHAEQGLVWDPAPALEAYFRRRNPMLQYLPGQSGAANPAYEHGSAAGRGITLSTPLQPSRSSPGSRPKALGPGRG